MFQMLMPANTVNRHFLALLLGCQERDIDAWEDAGMPVIRTKARFTGVIKLYNFDEVIGWLRQHPSV